MSSLEGHIKYYSINWDKLKSTESRLKKEIIIKHLMQWLNWVKTWLPVLFNDVFLLKITIGVKKSITRHIKINEDQRTPSFGITFCINSNLNLMIKKLNTNYYLQKYPCSLSSCFCFCFCCLCSVCCVSPILLNTNAIILLTIQSEN